MTVIVRRKILQHGAIYARKGERIDIADDQLARGLIAAGHVRPASRKKPAKTP